ncbi:hypothetical protein QJS04_geneDACA009298 [Acorus gramineus]|uniref:Translation machinery-associated protein 22 n=1 Tax=Acorus gramineus TaxID=55184 RepID=A0AAV9A2I0_ACOGR|nr:hypothetical protein QJS04_geneDACA009298 [Acorus gramineus]
MFHFFKFESIHFERERERGVFNGGEAGASEGSVLRSLWPPRGVLRERSPSLPGPHQRQNPISLSLSLSLYLSLKCPIFLGCSSCQAVFVYAEASDKAAEQLQSVGISSDGGDGAAPDTAPSASSAAPKQEEVKRLPGGKIKKKEKQEVVIEKVVRNKRKCITIVKGLDLFGIKLSEASKKLGKKFATGASVVKGPTEKEQIDVQGDIAYDVVEFLTGTWPDVIFLTFFFLL